MNKQLSFINEQNKEITTTGLCLYTDGAARNNPGPAGAGIIIKREKSIILKEGFFLGNKTNNQAEYLALILGLLLVKKHFTTGESLTIYSDSELLIKQMNGLYRVKNPDLQHFFRVAYMMSNDFNPLFKHILRAENKEADMMANRGIETKNNVPEHYVKVLHEYRIQL